MYKYPIICQTIENGQIYGVLIGTDLQCIERTAAAVRKRLGEWLSQKLRDEDWGYMYEPEIDKGELLLKKVRLRMAYRESKGSYPLPKPVTLNVPVVYGYSEEDSSYKCYIPWLDEEFYYYEERQLSGLIEHFVRECLEGDTPENIYRFLRGSEPWLETIRVQLPTYERQKNRKDHYLSEIFEKLQHIAEQLPVTRSVRSSLSIIPEAAWERTEQVSRLVDLLTDNKSNCIVIGESGVGKTAIINDAIKRAYQQTKNADGISFWRTTAQRLVADAKYLGEWQEICDRTVAHLQVVGGILWIQDLVQLAKTGGEGAEDSIASYLLPSIQNSDIRIIGELTIREYETLRRLLPGFVELFQVITIEALNQTQTLAVMHSFSNYIETNHHIKFEPDAIKSAYRLLNRYIRYDSFPGKAITFLTDCINYARKQKRSGIDQKLIETRFIENTGFPEILLKDELMLEMATLKAFFKARIIGQEHAIENLCSIICMFKAGLNDPDKPIATLLFSGPTGVGKTATAKALSNYFFDNGAREHPIFRLDMSEFQYPFQVRRLLGDESGQPSRLVEHVRKHPFSVILFDEIEKADASIYDVMLNLLDEGRLTDTLGRLIDFRNSILIMTTNLGAQSSASLGFITNSNATDQQAIRQHFRPEFYNRIDQLIGFNPLGAEQIKQIAKIELDAICKREGISKRELQLKFDQTVIDYVAAVGFHPKYGARPLQRAVEDTIVTKLSRWLLKNRNITKTTLHISYGEQGVDIEVTQG
ncbi:MAG: ATP-dependent Clp protease ATP-binding subunit [Gammaproteobacteria bacterium]|nr:MAG: ATP-dependent Clp protease ATP-binding subunit [Gammaproteobacteria bacterium]